MGRCKYCGGKIDFIKTKAGKLMPVDHGIFPFWDGALNKDNILTIDGYLLKCELTGPAHLEAGFGYRPHWASCPEARRRKQKVKIEIKQPSLF